IQTKKSKGYNLFIIDEGLFNYFLNERYLKDENLNFNNKDSRIRFIIRKLLLSNDYTKIESLSENMFVSTGTHKNDMNDNMQRLNKYEIENVRRPKYCNKIIGKEFQIRYSIEEFVLNNQQSDIGFSEQDTSSVKNQLVKLLKIYNIEIPEVKLYNL